jgi:hypothetical protein
MVFAATAPVERIPLVTPDTEIASAAHNQVNTAFPKATHATAD